MNSNRNPGASPLAAADAVSAWQALRLLNTYRLFIAILLLAGFVAPLDTLSFGATFPIGFYTVSAVYLCSVVVFALTLYLRQPNLGPQAHIQLYTDILLLAAATYTSGGVGSGLGVLIIVPAAGAGMLLPWRHALLFAALAALLLLGGELARITDIGPMAANLPQGALLGTVIFLATGLALAVSRRSAQAAALAERRTRDIYQLSTLNDRIIQQMEAGILLIDRTGTVLLVNASAQDLLGRDVALQDRPLADVSPTLADSLHSWQTTGRAPLGALMINDTDPGDPRRLQVQFSDLGEVGTLVTLEDAAFIEEQLQQLKLASLGRLTASIAHEVRNPLSAISHASQLLAESPNLNTEEQRFTQIIIDHCTRVNNVVESVLELSRRRTLDPEPVELTIWLDEFADQFRSQHGLDIDRLKIGSDRDAPLYAAMAADHLHQVVANLCGNALEHGQRSDGTPIRIQLWATVDGEHPVLEVEDNGIPVPADQVEQIFEPFYSTRHRGTGLGLFLAQELCEGNGARLRYRRIEHGNCFRIVMRPAEAYPPQPAVPGAAESPGRSPAA